MAPEILAKRGYTYPIDWWSLGVCAYELIFGRRPFRGRTNSALTHSISRDPLRFPENAEERCSKAGLHALKGVSVVCYDRVLCSAVMSMTYVSIRGLRIAYLQFLERDPFKRLACNPHGDGFEEIRQHAWFSSIDWVALQRKEIQAPFVPDVGGWFLSQYFIL